jgi:C4-dicarboxylate-specific signal transduction histidine kinase
LAPKLETGVAARGAAQQPLNTPVAGELGAEDILDQMLEITRNIALGEMASGVAHELNQPLGAIATYAQAGVRMLERNEPMTARAADVFKQISQEALNAGEGIRRIRRLFDQDGDRRERCRMSELLSELMPVLELAARRHAGRIEVQSSSDLPEIEVARPKIQHVVFALVQNAFEASPEDGSHPRVLIQVSSDRYGCETSVIDSGGGIHLDAQKSLFRPFFTTKPRGTGLGLASSRAIIESHQGTIGFENQPGGGCRFWFRLPIAVS